MERLQSSWSHLNSFCQPGNEATTQPLLPKAQEGCTTDTVHDNSYTKMEHHTQGQVLTSGRAGLLPAAQGEVEQRLPVKLWRWITDKHEEDLGEHSMAEVEEVQHSHRGPQAGKGLA